MPSRAEACLPSGRGCCANPVATPSMGSPAQRQRRAEIRVTADSVLIAAHCSLSRLSRAGGRPAGRIWLASESGGPPRGSERRRRYDVVVSPKKEAAAIRGHCSRSGRSEPRTVRPRHTGIFFESVASPACPASIGSSHRPDDRGFVGELTRVSDSLSAVYVGRTGHGIEPSSGSPGDSQVQWRSLAFRCARSAVADGEPLSAVVAGIDPLGRVELWRSRMRRSTIAPLEGPSQRALRVNTVPSQGSPPIESPAPHRSTLSREDTSGRSVNFASGVGRRIPRAPSAQAVCRRCTRRSR